MLLKNVGLLAVVSLLTILEAQPILHTVSAENQDNIEYGQVYDCGDGKPKFKVISCTGPGKLDKCEIFTINELSPGGGFKGSPYRAHIEDYYLGREGCKIKGRVPVKSSAKQGEGPLKDTAVASKMRTPVKGETGGAVSCTASSEDSEGKTANEKTFRGVIRRLWEKEASEGMDGSVTIDFQNLIVGAPRAWRATWSDAYSQADRKKPIYPVRATFATCTDYKTAISRRRMERIYDCFVHKAGGWQCTQTGESGALALKDKEEYVPKKRP